MLRCPDCVNYLRVDLVPLYAPEGRESKMFETLRMLLAGVGAAAILGALAFVTLLIGVLVNAMIVLTAGPVVDRILKEGDGSQAG
ncbi:MAG: hypothetical protein AABZ01_14360 [Gemmatimonadota bacterium]